MADHNMGEINLKLNKPDVFDGKRDFLAVNSWLFKIQQYLSLASLSNPYSELSDENRITFASSFMTSTAAAWWYTIVQSGHTPSTWDEFRTLVLNEFVPADHIRRAHDRLRRLRQNVSVSKYISEFRNCVLTINDRSEGELMDSFVHGLKPEIRLEVLKIKVSCFEDMARIALRVDSALWSTNNFKPSFVQTGITVQDPMEVGNVQQHNIGAQNRQREYGLRNNQCVVCHKKGCRPWKCSKKGKVNNSRASLGDKIIDTVTFDDAVDEDSEN